MVVINAGLIAAQPLDEEIVIVNSGMVVSTPDPFSPVTLINAGLMVSVRADHTPTGGVVSSHFLSNVEEGDMIYSDIFFPECISYGSTGSAVYITDKIEVESGREQRNQRRTYPKHEYNINMENLGAAEVSEVMNIWHVVKGDFAAFMFLDPMDHTSNNSETALSGAEVTPFDQPQGVMVAGQSAYELFKTYTKATRSQTRRIRFPKEGTLRVAIDGVEITAFDFDYSTGHITLPLVVPVYTAAMTKTATHIVGGDYSAFTVGDLIYIDGWDNGNYDYIEGVKDPLRITEVNLGSIAVEQYSGFAYSAGTVAVETDVTIRSARAPAGAEITAGYYFYVPVRFGDGNDSESEITAGMQDSVFASFSNITLREVFE